MLVVSRRKNEAIVIDGAIEIEVVNVTKATVRVRLSAPRCMQVVRGFVKKELGAEAEPATKANPAGIDTLNLTLVSQQVIELGKSISLGVVDVDRSRALFFVDAPPGTSVLATDQRAVCCQEPDRQAKPVAVHEPTLRARRCRRWKRRLSNDPSRAIVEKAGDPGPHVLPFPSPPARQGASVKTPLASRKAAVHSRIVKPGLP